MTRFWDNSDCYVSCHVIMTLFFVSAISRVASGLTMMVMVLVVVLEPLTSASLHVKSSTEN
eukprot:CAMPEP_0118700864 /NCGR_PEP_ID=MMETSP0800-20121206/16863_1 /TAXON_ID=210618 ORGANISM="Striatella unipunctata, Strain CCMP2910" /NCGR_SAMPLE_ID=MMETSP0800 /ASSEMBLY_ACC=CAM_ASM_000638 /LENGTH=60 /DNA_ID=CAMNT_0006601583 /DNA_START=15 /DNA_END=194 /DNA_ORIENTATION=+